MRRELAWLVWVLFTPACATVPVPHDLPVAAPAAAADPTPHGWTRPPQRVIPWGRYPLAPPGEEPDYEYDPERGEYRFPQEKRNGRPDVHVPEVPREPRCPEEYNAVPDAAP